LIKELGPEIKEFLKSAAENHKRMTEADERRAATDKPMSESFQGLVEQLKTGITINVAPPVKRKSRKSNDKHHREVKRIILKMRKKNETYEDITAYLEEQGVPTFIKRGRWHAQTVHRLYQEYGES